MRAGERSVCRTPDPPRRNAARPPGSRRRSMTACSVGACYVAWESIVTISLARWPPSAGTCGAIRAWAVHRAPLSALARTWRAVWEVGERHALLDGASALIAAGMTGFAVDREHVSIVHRSRVAPVEGVQIHKLIRRVPDEAATVGVPHVRPALACVRAAHWAVSDRQAALLLVMPVQQRLVTGAQLLEAVALNPGRNRRALIARLVGDIADGSHSLGELDVVAALRRRGLPEPSRQVLRRGPQGVVYLDICFDEVNLVVEVDGAGHWQGLAQATDDLRQNEVSIGGRTVLRVSLIGWRLNPEAYIEQIARAYWSRR